MFVCCVCSCSCVPKGKLVAQARATDSRTFSSTPTYMLVRDDRTSACRRVKSVCLFVVVCYKMMIKQSPKRGAYITCAPPERLTSHWRNSKQYGALVFGNQAKTIALFCYGHFSHSLKLSPLLTQTLSIKSGNMYLV